MIMSMVNFGGVPRTKNKEQRTENQDSRAKSQDNDNVIEPPPKETSNQQLITRDISLKTLKFELCL